MLRHRLLHGLIERLSLPLSASTNEVNTYPLRSSYEETEILNRILDVNQIIISISLAVKFLSRRISKLIGKSIENILRFIHGKKDVI